MHKHQGNYRPSRKFRSYHMLETTLLMPDTQYWVVGVQNALAPEINTPLAYNKLG